MNTPLAWLLLIHQKMRLLVAISGVAFAVLLMFMNLGFLGAVSRTASLVYEQLDADIFLISPKAEMIAAARPFPRSRLYQAASIADVVKTSGLLVTAAEWPNPNTRMNQGILVYGFDPDDRSFLMPELQSAEMLAALQRPDAILIDRLSNPALGSATPGWAIELNRKRVWVAGSYTLGSGLAATGTAIVNDQNFLRLFPLHPSQTIHLGLIKVRSSELAEEIAIALRQRLPNDVLILTKSAMIARESNFWVNATSTGFIFSLGVAVSFVVGTAIVYQILATDVREHLPEYATLKAIGYRNHHYQIAISIANCL